MKVLVVQESDWLERNPHQQHHLMERLSLRGHEILVIDYDIDWKKKSKKNIYEKRTIFEGVHKISAEASIRVIRPGVIRIPVLDYISIFFSHKKEIKLQIKEFKPDVIIGLGIINTFIASNLAKKHNIPFVYYWIDVLHNLISSNLFQPLGEYFERHSIKNSSHVITINQKLADYVFKMGNKKENISVIGAGIDLNRFNPDVDGSKIRGEYRINNDDFVLFFMGWLYHFSGLKEVVMELTKSNDKNSRLLIVGYGDAFDDLRKIKDAHDVYNQIILTGKQPYEKIPEFIASSDVCLLPAYPNEDVMQNIVPIKMYEYMAMSKPVITTKLQGIMKEFGNDHGVIYIDKSEDTVEKAIEIKENNLIQEYGRKARKFAEKYSWSNKVDDFEMFLEEITCVR